MCDLRTARRAAAQVFAPCKHDSWLSSAPARPVRASLRGARENVTHRRASPGYPSIGTAHFGTAVGLDEYSRPRLTVRRLKTISTETSVLLVVPAKLFGAISVAPSGFNDRPRHEDCDEWRESLPVVSRGVEWREPIPWAAPRCGPAPVRRATAVWFFNRLVITVEGDKPTPCDAVKIDPRTDRRVSAAVRHQDVR